MTYPVFCLMILTMIQHGILLEKNLNFSPKAARHSGSKWYIVPPPPPNFLQICGQLLRYCEKINPQRIKDTPPVNFFLCLVLASPISQKDCYKKANRKTILKNNFRQGAGDFK